MGASSPSEGYHLEIKNRYENNAKLYDCIPKDQYLCPQCDRIPEIKNVNTDNGIIEFNCVEHGDISMKVYDFLNSMKLAKTYFKIRCCECNKLQYDYRDAQIFQYCCTCGNHFCGEHAEKHKKKPLSHNKMIPVNEKNGRCLDHFDEGSYTEYCLDCKKNICPNRDHKDHNNHEKMFLFKLVVDKKIIEERNETLLNIIKLNEIILDTYERCPDNFLHKRNLMNLADSIKNPKSIDPKYILFKFEEMQINYNNHIKCLEAINKELKAFDIKLNGNETDLILKNMKLNNNSLKIISQIQFNNLINIDISGNDISDISCLNNMNLSKVKTINMSDNKIKNVDVFENLNLKNAEEIYLENNLIEDVKAFLKVILPNIKKLCFDINKMKSNHKVIDQLRAKYDWRLNICSLSFKEFNEKYKSNISETSMYINITDKEYGYMIIKELSLIRDSYDKLQKLTLMTCAITDISSLKNITFVNLETLDLSDNKIETIEVFAEMKMDKLNKLFLNLNSISDIYPLKRLKLKKLETINLEGNPIFDGKFKKQNEEIINNLKGKNIEVLFEEE
jgi:Leucine-rich repeat (LRR) protein